MEYQEAKYIIDYFPRLMTELERKALRQYLLSIKLGNQNDYENRERFEKRKELFEKRLGYVENSKLLEKFDDGYENFVLRTAQRINKDSPDEFCLNKCPKCGFITRTPYAKQCRKCSCNWHDKIQGEFVFEDSFRITKRPYLWIIGELSKGNVQVGNKIDLTHFQLNIIAEIKQIELALKSKNEIKKEYLSLGIEVNEEQENLVKKYLTKSAKTIMIIKE